MTTFIKSKAAKAVVGLLALALFAVAARSASAFTFTANLTVGTTSAEVVEAQKFLNSKGFVVSTTGAGSPGMESNYFGAKTKAAVAAFQAANGISPAAGYWGALTRAKVNAMQGGSTGGTLPAGCTSTSGFSPITGAPCNGATGPAQGTGPVTVALAADNPAAGYIVAGGATVDLAHFAFNGSGTVNSITLQRTGLSTNTALSNVYLYNGATRITDAASVNAQGMITFNGVNLMVNGSTTISVKADVSSSANGQTVGVTLTGYSVNGSAATANLAGNVMSISSGSGILGSVAFVSPSTTSPSVNAGVTGYTLWTSPLQVNLHTMWLKSAAFHFVGSAPSDSLANVGLFIDGVKVASSTGVNSLGYIVFDLTSAPFSVSTGSHTVDVRADIVKGSYRTVQLTLQNAGDFMLTDSQVGVNVAAVSPLTSSTTFSPVAGNNISISAGSLSIQINPSFNSMTTVTGGSTNAVIAKYDVKAFGEDEKIQTITLTPSVSGGSVSDSGSTTKLNNVQLYFNGSQVGSSQNYTGSALTFNLGSSLVVPAGTTGTLEVRADLQNDTGGNYTAGTVSVTSATVPVGGAQGMNSLQTNGSAVTIPTTNGLSISTGSVTVAKNLAYASQTFAANTPNVKIGSFVITNGSSSESVTVTNLNVGLVLTTAASTNYSNLKTSETSGSGSTPIQPTTASGGSTSSNNFSVNFTIPAGGTKTIDVYADLGSASSGSVRTDLNITARGTSSNVSICTASNTDAGNGCTTGYKAGQTMTIGNATFGTPVVVTSGSTLSQYVAGGTTTGATDATKAQFKFTASSGTAKVIDLGFYDSVGAHAITKVRVGNVEGTNTGADKFFLYGLNIDVPNGGAGAFVDAFASYSPVGPTGLTTTTTGDITSLLKVSYIKYQVGNSTLTLCANGYSPAGGNCDATTSMPISSAQTMSLVGSKPIVTVAQPSGVILTTGPVEAIDVTIKADDKGPITINSFPITTNISASGGTPSFTTGTDFTVKDANNQTITATGSRSNATGSETTTVTLGSGYLLSAGQSQTFRVFVPVAAVGTGTLPNTYLYSSLAASSGFSWTDTAGSASVASTGVTYMYNYPSTFTSSIHN
jgi:hypothetical protein